MSFIEPEIAAQAATAEVEAQNYDNSQDHDNPFTHGNPQHHNAYNFSPVMEEVENLRAQNQSLEEAVRFHKNNMKFQSDRINNLESEKEVLNKKVAELQNEVSMLQVHDEKMQNAITEFQNSFCGLDDALKTCEVTSAAKSTGDASTATLMPSPIPEARELNASDDEYQNEQWVSEQPAQQPARFQNGSPTAHHVHSQQPVQQQAHPVTEYDYNKPRQTFRPPMQAQSQHAAFNQTNPRHASQPTLNTANIPPASAVFIQSDQSANTTLQQHLQQQEQQYQLQKAHETQLHQQEQLQQAHELQLQREELQRQHQRQQQRISMPPPPSPSPASRLTSIQPLNVRGMPASSPATQVSTPIRPATTSKWFTPGPSNDSYGGQWSPRASIPSQPVVNANPVANISIMRPPNPRSTLQSRSHSQQRQTFKRPTPATMEIHQYADVADRSGGVNLTGALAQTRRISTSSGIMSGGNSGMGLTGRGASSMANTGPVGGVSALSANEGPGRSARFFGTQQSQFDNISQLLAPPAKKRKPWVPRGGPTGSI